MKNNNVCKFPIGDSSNSLSLHCFVFETSIETMRQKIKLEHNRMILVEQGEGEFSIDGTPCSFHSGALIFCFTGEEFTLTKGDSVRFLYIDFDGIRAANLLRRFGVSPHTRKRDNFNSLIPFCKDCLLSTTPENIDTATESVLLYVLSRLSSSASLHNDILEQIIDITDKNFRDSELSITLIAKEIGYNPKYLSHFFKQKMNISYSEYLRTIRFKYAISLFELGIISVKNVAFLSGFSDPLYFSNAFKKSIGISPKEFIEKLSQRDSKQE